MRLLLLTFLFFTNFCIAQDTTNQSKMKYYIEKVEKYLDREKALSSFYSISKEGIKMYASPKDKLNNKKEFLIRWNEIQIFNEFEFYECNRTRFDTYKLGVVSSGPGLCERYFKPKDTTKQLSDYKIAIDAGHTAGDITMGEIEKKDVKFKRDTTNGLNDSISFAEGMLTFATAKLLKEKLEAEGAQVFMTRTFNGGTAFGVTFDDWLKTSYKNAVDSLFKIGEINADKKEWFLNNKCTKRDKFRLIFKDIELQKRGEIINNYYPDFTIIIHYNVDETNTGWTKPSNKDFDMTFVGGAFMKNDLSTIDKRFEFLRLLISDDLEKSITLSSAVVTSFEKTLLVKTATINDAKYLRQSCFATNEKGVYCRNLQLTRFVHSALVYGETLYQDNINECKLLNKETDKTKNERVQQVAEAYYQGILNYISISSKTKSK